MTRNISLALVAMLFLSGCITSKELNKRSSALEHLLSENHEAMYICTPVELARATAYVDFSLNESALARPMTAKQFVDKAAAASKEAFVGSRDSWCMKDRDGDGIPDDVDQCPDEPEDFDGFADEDGCPDPDNDQDGVPDGEDECPNEPGPASNKGCPILDTDGDGVLDDEDECPNEPGPIANRGCPWPDRDGDGVLDKDDKCPDDPGPVENHGCPYPDRDGDGVFDKDDKCPDEPGPPANFGCPYKTIEITESQIVLHQRVFFQTNKAVIMPRSFAMLNEVARAMTGHPKMIVRVEGHTDSRGRFNYNLKLSQARADSVRSYLIAQGVDPARLTSVGYGPERPIDDNATSAGRANNRRVEFHIVSQ